MKLTDEDLGAIKDLMVVTIKEQVNEIGLATKEDIKHLPTKEEYYAREDETMAKLKAIREEMTIMGGQVSENRERIEKLETSVFKN